METARQIAPDQPGFSIFRIVQRRGVSRHRAGGVARIRLLPDPPGKGLHVSVLRRTIAIPQGTAPDVRPAKAFLTLAIIVILTDCKKVVVPIRALLKTKGPFV